MGSKNCKTCHGHGFYHIYVDSGPLAHDYQEKIPCPTCSVVLTVEDLPMTEGRDCGLTLNNPRLTAHGMSIKNEWKHLFEKEGCKCSPAGSDRCRYCAHPGNPNNMRYDTASWEETPAPTRADRIMEAMREIAGRGNT